MSDRDKYQFYNAEGIEVMSHVSPCFYVWRLDGSGAPQGVSLPYIMSYALLLPWSGHVRVCIQQRDVFDKLTSKFLGKEYIRKEIGLDLQNGQYFLLFYLMQVNTNDNGYIYGFLDLIYRFFAGTTTSVFDIIAKYCYCLIRIYIN